MAQAQNREDVARQVRSLLDDCVGGELGGYDSLRATLEIEIARRQVANMEKDQEEFASSDTRDQWFTEHYPKALARLKEAEERLAKLEVETTRRMAEWAAMGR